MVSRGRSRGETGKRGQIYAPFLINLSYVQYFSLLCCFVFTEDILVGFCPIMIDLALERMCIRDASDPRAAGPGRLQFQFVLSTCSLSESRTSAGP